VSDDDLTFGNGALRDAALDEGPVKRVAGAPRGFTLVELMISLVIFSIAIAGVLSVAVSMNQGFREQRQATSAEDNARGAMDFIADAIRSASPGVQQTGVIRDDLTCTCFAASASTACPAPIGAAGVAVTNSTTAPDTLRVVFASGGVVTSTRTTYSKGDTSITLTETSGISVGDQLLVTNLTDGDIVTVTAVSTTSGVGNVTVAASPCSAFTTTYPTLSIVVRVLRAKFFIDTTNANGFGTNVLLMDPDDDGTATPEPLAENVEDLQVALGLDDTSATPAGQVDYWEYSSTTNGAKAGTLRAARLTFVTLTKQALQGGTSTFKRPAAEDHATASSFDNYRRRVLNSAVEIRNLGGSP
jgi:prepilin-type N-terminal cleavage/methylation domain-containing protein